ncbi:glycosyltransferase [Paenibacillus sepulcri]|uniref:Glycosyltransferase n=1 Tax=Paenibacillus sepulcri TaxID=359917 RepID=A0ABS7C820_9BACL|nr:glycosyltransferase [Paenibacillus sepulcri]
MITISLCMIVRNEEKILERCLSGVKDIADEIIIVDTGSTDKTKEIAAAWGAKVYDFEWIDDFAAARNYSFSKAACEYILWLDADDYIEEKDRTLLKELKASLKPDIQSVSMAYNLAFDSEGKVTSSLRRNRLVRRDCHFLWLGPVHEYLAVFGSSLASEVCITHQKDKPHTDRNLRIYRKRAEQGEAFSPRDLYYYANELREHAFNEEACDYYERFLATGLGWIEDNFQACLKLAECRERLGDKQMQFAALCRTLQYDIPRSEFCCRLGSYFFADNRYIQAIYWYEQAIALPDREESMGMKDTVSSTWLPHLQLCLCYDRLGDSHKANYHNEVALHYYPSHPSMIYNRNYYKELLGAGYVELTWPGGENK